jgi:hypothetical protein
MEKFWQKPRLSAQESLVAELAVKHLCPQEPLAGDGAARIKTALGSELLLSGKNMRDAANRAGVQATEKQLRILKGELIANRLRVTTPEQQLQMARELRCQK